MVHRNLHTFRGRSQGLDYALGLPMQLLVAHVGGRSFDAEHTADHRLSGDHSSEHHDLDGAEEIRRDDIASGLPFIPIALVSRTDILSAFVESLMMWCFVTASYNPLLLSIQHDILAALVALVEYSVHLSRDDAVPQRRLVDPC